MPSETLLLSLHREMVHSLYLLKIMNSTVLYFQNNVAIYSCVLHSSCNKLYVLFLLKHWMDLNTSNHYQFYPSPYQFKFKHFGPHHFCFPHFSFYLIVIENSNLFTIPLVLYVIT